MAGKIKLEDLPFGTLNSLSDGSGPSTDRRRTDPLEFLRLSTEAAYGKNTLRNKDTFNGIVMASRVISYPSYKNKTALFEELLVGTDEEEGPSDYNTYAYKVYIPEIEPRCIPKGTGDPILVTYPDVYSDITDGKSAIPNGTLVSVKYDDVENLFNPRIVAKTGGPIQLANFDPGATASGTFQNGISTTLEDLVDPVFGAKITIQEPSLSIIDELRYPAGIFEPRTQKAVDLLTKALRALRLPEEWAMLESLHYIMDRESSGGKVGIPNYRYRILKGREPEEIPNIQSDPDQWPEVWKAAASGSVGIYDPVKGTVPPRKGSTATGLGQLIKDNVEAYYPYGTAGIGNADAEAYGFVNYIAQVYGDPDTARSVYGQIGYYKVGDYAWVPEERRNREILKEFEEGY
jgi:hypothetical protein